MLAFRQCWSCARVAPESTLVIFVSYIGAPPCLRLRSARACVARVSMPRGTVRGGISEVSATSRAPLLGGSGSPTLCGVPTHDGPEDPILVALLVRDAALGV